MAGAVECRSTGLQCQTLAQPTMHIMLTVQWIQRQNGWRLMQDTLSAGAGAFSTSRRRSAPACRGRQAAVPRGRRAEAQGSGCFQGLDAGSVAGLGLTPLHIMASSTGQL